MDDKQPDLAQRLRLLEQILGESCRVTDEPSEWEAYEKNLEKQNEDTKASQEVSNIGDQLLAEEPSPVEYSVLNPPADLYHEREPGTQGEKNLVYCSWQIITSYPEHFIGKTNRQKVSIAPPHCGRSLSNSARLYRSLRKYCNLRNGTCKRCQPNPILLKLKISVTMSTITSSQRNQHICLSRPRNWNTS